MIAIPMSLGDDKTINPATAPTIATNIQTVSDRRILAISDTR